MSDAANNLATGTAHGPDTVDGIRDLIFAALCEDFEPGTIAPGDAFTFITIDDSQADSKLALVNQVNNAVWLVTVQKAKIHPDVAAKKIPFASLQQQVAQQVPS